MGLVCVSPFHRQLDWTWKAHAWLDPTQISRPRGAGAATAASLGLKEKTAAILDRPQQSKGGWMGGA